MTPGSTQSWGFSSGPGRLVEGGTSRFGKLKKKKQILRGKNLLVVEPTHLKNISQNMSKWESSTNRDENNKLHLKPPPRKQAAQSRYIIKESDCSSSDEEMLLVEDMEPTTLECTKP